MTSRVETTSLPNHIQMTKETAQLLADSGREHWVQKRQDKVFAKGMLPDSQFELMIDSSPLLTCCMKGSAVLKLIGWSSHLCVVGRQT